MKTLVVVLAALSACSCATSTTTVDSPATHTGRILCMEILESGDVVVDCLDALSADPVEVARRVAVYNEGKDKGEGIGCMQRQALGSNLSRWRCTRIGRSGNPTGEAIGAFELLNKEGFRSWSSQ